MLRLQSLGLGVELPAQGKGEAPVDSRRPRMVFWQSRKSFYLSRSVLRLTLNGTQRRLGWPRAGRGVLGSSLQYLSKVCQQVSASKVALDVIVFSGLLVCLVVFYLWYLRQEVLPKSGEENAKTKWCNLVVSTLICIFLAMFLLKFLVGMLAAH